TSRYFETSNLTNWFNTGCADANRNEHGVMAADWGWGFVSGSYVGASSVGPINTAFGVNTIEDSTDSYIRGWAHCAPHGNGLIVALAINNQNGYGVLRTGGPANDVVTHAKRWGQMVADLNARLVTENVTNVIAAGGCDCEIEWGPFPAADSWVKTF